MARDRANIQTGIWTDQDWRDLPMAPQWLYKLLMTHPTLSYAGVVDWRLGRIAAMASDVTPEMVDAAARHLQRERFVFIDEDTEEILVRSFLRHDGLLKQPKLSVSMVNAFGAIASKPIRMVVTHELQRLYGEHPDWAAFRQERVQALLKGEGKDMAELMGNEKQDLTQGFTLNAAQADPLHTTTATTTATPTEVGGSGGKRKPERTLPTGWLPNEAHRAYADKHSINLDFQAERFTSWVQAKDVRYRDWDAAFRNWLLKAEKTTTTKNALWDS